MESDRLCGGKKRKPGICLWKDLTAVDVDILQRTRSMEECHRALSRVLHVEYGASEPRVVILLDLFYYLLRFCQDHGFSSEQSSCVFSAVNETHAACVDSPLGSPDDCFTSFQDLLLRHAVHMTQGVISTLHHIFYTTTSVGHKKRPPFSLSLFSRQQIQEISHYFLNTYFRHFKLYKYVFTPKVHLDLSICYEGIHELVACGGPELEAGTVCEGEEAAGVDTRIDSKAASGNNQPLE